MNSLIADIARRAGQAQTGHERMEVVQEVKEIANGEDPVLFLLSELKDGLQGKLKIESCLDDLDRKGKCVSAHSLRITVDGLEIEALCGIRFEARAGGIVTVNLELIPPSLEVETEALLLLEMAHNHAAFISPVETTS